MKSKFLVGDVVSFYSRGMQMEGEIVKVVNGLNQPIYHILCEATKYTKFESEVRARR